MAQTEIQEFPFKHKKKSFYCEGDETLEQVTEVVECLSLDKTQLDMALRHLL